MIIEGKTAEGLVAHAERALQEGWWYVWGTFGNVLTKDKLAEKVAQYPSLNTYDKHSAHIGQIVSDCIGLIKSYMWWDDTKSKPIYNVNQDIDTGTMYNLATRKGPISFIPEEPGLCVYMSGHVGVYIGRGWVIECTGGRGVVKTPLKGKGSTRWKSWFCCPYIQYPDGNNPAVLCAGSAVRVKAGTKTYQGGGLASWVYQNKYTVMEIKGDRVVIGVNGIVTAAVHANDLILI